MKAVYCSTTTVTATTAVEVNAAAEVEVAEEDMEHVVTAEAVKVIVMEEVKTDEVAAAVAVDMLGITHKKLGATTHSFYLT